MPLSDSWLKSNHGKQIPKVLERQDRDGLGVRISRKGKIVFQLRYRFLGKANRLDLGTYPLMTLKQARGESARLRAALEQGHDPKQLKLREQFERASNKPLKAVLLEWYENYCISNKKGHAQILRSFELHVFPQLGKYDIQEIPLNSWMNLLDPLSKTEPAIAARILVNTQQMYKWAVRRQYCERNPLSEIRAKADLNISKGKVSRVFSDEEIQYFWEAVDGSRIKPKNKLFLKLCLIYGCRTGELRLAEKCHIDFKKGIWTVPAENHKVGLTTNRALVRPILPFTAELFNEAMELSPSKINLFCNAQDTDQMGRSSPLQLPYNIRQWLRRHRKYEMPHWSMHDLRRTARTNFSTLTEPHVAEIMLGHTLPGQWHVYDHHDYLEEQRKAYEGWVSRLQQLTGSLY